MRTRRFVNRDQELRRLEEWWTRPDDSLALVWGRRRVGKTALIERFARDKPVVFHTGASRPVADELQAISRIARTTTAPALRDLESRPFVDWYDCLEFLADAARDRPLLFVLDEFPEMAKTTPELESMLRAFWDRARGKTRLRILLCGSAVSTMAAIQEERSPLYGRIDLAMRLDPFSPHESAKMLPRLKPADRALVWGIAGGVPLYLEWWDPAATVRKNLERLICTPGGRLLTEGDYVLATEGGSGDLARQVLHAIAAGRTRFQEIEQVVHTNPGRVLDNLMELQLVERLSPVTERGKRTRRRIYRIADNFLSFWLGPVSKYRAEIDRGLGRSILPVLVSELADHMGGRYEEAFRAHLRRLAARGEFGPNVVGLGPFWTNRQDPGEIDAVVLAGRSQRAMLVGEAKWSRVVNGAKIRRALQRKAQNLPSVSRELVYAVCAREKVTAAEGVRAFTARHLFGR